MPDRKNEEYEILWKSGHVDRIWACQVTWPNNSSKMLGALFGGRSPEEADDIPSIIHFHADLNGKWTFVMSADENDLLGIRNLSVIGRDFDDTEKEG